MFARRYGVAFGCVALALAGCATVPEKSELTRLDESELESVVVGNTVTMRTDYGHWAEYWASDASGVGRAWGSWGSESSPADYEITDGGEACGVYSGDQDWAQGNEYCWVMYSGPEGNYYIESTKNTRDPDREGRMTQVTVREGDPLELGG